MNKIYISLLFISSVTLSYSNITNDNYKTLSLVPANFIKSLQDFWNSTQEINKFKQIIKKKSSCVVLIYTISDKKKFKNKKEYFYNSAIKPRDKKKSYKYGVTCGVVLSQDGVVVTTYDGTKNSDRYIVAIDSENNQNDELYGEIELNNHTYNAHIIKSFPSLNLVFLQIETNKSEKFDFINIANNATLHNKEENNYLIYDAVIIGKCKGEHFVKPRQTYNAKNKFDMVVDIIGGVSYKKINGVPTLILYTPTTGDGSIPENHGGAIIDSDGKLLGIPIWKDYLNLPFSFAIPASTIKICLGLTLHTKTEISTDCGIKVTKLDKLQIKLLKKALRDSTKILNDTFLNDLKNNQLSTRYNTLQQFIENGSFGVVVNAIKDSSISERAGVLIGDILLKFNNDCILDEETFYNLEAYSIDASQITLTVMRDNKIFELNISK